MFVRRKLVLTLMIMFAMRASAAYAHGVVGDFIFLEPLITQDPAPANEFDVLGPSWVKSSDGNSYSISSSIEKVLWIDDNYMPRFSVGAAVSGSISRRITDRFSMASAISRCSRSGRSSIRRSMSSWRRSARKSRCPSATPVFSRRVIRAWGRPSCGKRDGRSPRLAGAEVLATVGCSDRLWLRAGARRTYQSSHVFRRRGRVLASISEQQRSGHRTEMAAAQYVPVQRIQLRPVDNGTPKGRPFPRFSQLQGLAYVSYHFEVELGIQFALNNASKPGTHAAILGLLDMFDDPFFPKWGNWTINRGPGE